MTTRRDVARLAESLGAELVVHNARPVECELIAPLGHHWTEGGAQGCALHVLVGFQSYGKSASDVWDDLYDRARYGGPGKCPADCDFWADWSDE